MAVSGIECIAEMNDFLREAVRAYHNISESDLRLILLQRGERILPELTESLAEFAHKLLAKRGVEIRLGWGLKALSADAVIVEEKGTRKTETIATRTAVATVPAGPHPLLTALPFPQDKGRIVVNQQTEVPGWPGVWALGDCAAINRWTDTFRHRPHSTHCDRRGLARRTSSPRFAGRRKRIFPLPVWGNSVRLAVGRPLPRFSACISRA